MTGYNLSRNWFDFCFENPEKIKPAHTAIYMFALEHWNRLGQKRKFGFPSQMTMDAVGIKSYNTYIPAFNDLVEWGFFELVEKSKNQYSSNIIALSNIDKAPDKALDKALIKHKVKHLQSKCSIDKQYNNRTMNKERGDAKQVAESLLSAIQESDPTHRYNQNPPSLQSWVTDIDRAMRLDGRTKDDLMHMIQILFYDNNDVSLFWRSNIESGKKLRAKFDQIKSQLQRGRHGKNTKVQSAIDSMFQQA